MIVPLDNNVPITPVFGLVELNALVPPPIAHCRQRNALSVSSMLSVPTGYYQFVLHSSAQVEEFYWKKTTEQNSENIIKY